MSQSRALLAIKKELLVVPEMMPLEKLLTRFRDQQAHLAVVVDEFGVNVGIVTLQRVIAEVIGQLSDELGLGRWEFGGSPPTSSWWTARAAEVIAGESIESQKSRQHGQ